MKLIENMKACIISSFLFLLFSPSYAQLDTRKVYLKIFNNSKTDLGIPSAGIILRLYTNGTGYVYEWADCHIAFFTEITWLRDNDNLKLFYEDNRMTSLHFKGRHLINKEPNAFIKANLKESRDTKIDEVLFVNNSPCKRYSKPK